VSLVARRFRGRSVPWCPAHREARRHQAAVTRSGHAHEGVVRLPWSLAGRGRRRSGQTGLSRPPNSRPRLRRLLLCAKTGRARTDDLRTQARAWREGECAVLGWARVQTESLEASAAARRCEHLWRAADNRPHRWGPGAPQRGHSARRRRRSRWCPGLRSAAEAERQRASEDRTGCRCFPRQRPRRATHQCRWRVPRQPWCVSVWGVGVECFPESLEVALRGDVTEALSTAFGAVFHRRGGAPCGPPVQAEAQ
jgi:hypothetical protein